MTKTPRAHDRPDDPELRAAVPNRTRKRSIRRVRPTSSGSRTKAQLAVKSCGRPKERPRCGQPGRHRLGALGRGRLTLDQGRVGVQDEGATRFNDADREPGSPVRSARCHRFQARPLRDERQSARATHVQLVVAVPAAASVPIWTSHGQTASGGASMVMPRVSIAVETGTSSSPGSGFAASVGSMPQVRRQRATRLSPFRRRSR